MGIIFIYSGSANSFMKLLYALLPFAYVQRLKSTNITINAQQKKKKKRVLTTAFTVSKKFTNFKVRYPAIVSLRSQICDYFHTLYIRGYQAFWANNPKQTSQIFCVPTFFYLFLNIPDLYYWTTGTFEHCIIST